MTNPVRVNSPAHLIDHVLAVFARDPAVRHLAVLREALLDPRQRRHRSPVPIPATTVFEALGSRHLAQ